MSYYQVSEENMQKVEAYFVEKVKNGGSNRFEATVVDIADGAGVALATAHKAIKQLAEERKITIHKPSSRRFPIAYVYNNSIEGFEKKADKEDQIEYLQKLVRDLKKEVAELTSENQNLKGTINIMNNNILNSVSGE